MLIFTAFEILFYAFVELRVGIYLVRLVLESRIQPDVTEHVIQGSKYKNEVYNVMSVIKETYNAQKDTQQHLKKVCSQTSITKKVLCVIAMQIISHNMSIEVSGAPSDDSVSN